MSRNFHWIFAGAEMKLIQFNVFINFSYMYLQLSNFFNILILLNHFSINCFPYLYVVYLDFLTTKVFVHTIFYYYSFR